MPSHTRAQPIDPDIALVASKFGADPRAVFEARRLAQSRHGLLTSSTVEAVTHALRLLALRAFRPASG